MTYNPIPKAQKPEADRPVVLEKRSFFSFDFDKQSFLEGSIITCHQALIRQQE
jgi:hypothetical protein